MSEYQYYEFRAIDRPLDEKAIQALRDLAIKMNKDRPFQEKLLGLCEKHRRKPSLVRRLNEAGLC